MTAEHVDAGPFDFTSIARIAFPGMDVVTRQLVNVGTISPAFAKVLRDEADRQARQIWEAVWGPYPDAVVITDEPGA